MCGREGAEAEQFLLKMGEGAPWKGRGRRDGEVKQGIVIAKWSEKYTDFLLLCPLSTTDN